MIVLRNLEKSLRTWFYSMDRLGTAYTEESKIMNHNCAKDLRMLTIRNIMDEKYSGGYAPLSEKYEDWKARHGGETGFWKLWGDLVRAISIRETPKGYTVGIEKNVLPSRSSSMGKTKKITPIWKYAAYGELGYSARQVGFMFRDQKARPVFKPSAEEFRLSFLDKRRNDAFDKIKRAW